MRTASGGSVKDLVKGFETLEKQQAREHMEKVTRLRRVRSVGEWAAKAGPGAAARQNAKPVWK